MNSLIVAAVLSSLGATTPTQDLIDLSKIVHETPAVNWQHFRVISFTHLDDSEAVRMKGDAKFFVETVNKARKVAGIYEINRNLWAINTYELNWKTKDWDDMSAKWQYYQGLPEKPITYLHSKMGTKFPIMRADVFIREIWAPEWYTKFLDLPATRGLLWKELNLDAKWVEKSTLGIIPASDVQKNPRKVAYLRAGERDVYVTMNYENARNKNDSLRNPTNFNCDYNEIAVEMLNGLDLFYANAGGNENGSMNGSTATGNMDVKNWGLVKQIPLKAGEDHAQGGQILLGISCIGCHAGSRPLEKKLANLETLKLRDSEWSYGKFVERFDSERLINKANKSNLRWRLALKAINGRTPTENEASWRKTFKDFDADVNLTKAASEVGVKESGLRQQIERWLKSNNDNLMAAILKGSISRQEFEQINPRLRGLYRMEDKRAIAVAWKR